MKDIPILWYQCSDKFPIWDFCYSAVFGAEQNGTKHKPFETVDQIDANPYNIIVGSVEECSKWLKNSGFEVPIEINIEPEMFRVPFPKQSWLDINTKYPVFIKPKDQIKAFTGTVVKDKDDAEMVLNYYDGEIWVSPVQSFDSEWRCYIYKGNILKVCNYRGDSTWFPETEVIRDLAEEYINRLDYKAFTIDFGVLSSGKTVIIEGNDMWAIGNYGLEPSDYYQAIKDRWYQITGLIK